MKIISSHLYVILALHYSRQFSLYVERGVQFTGTRPSALHIVPTAIST